MEGFKTILKITWLPVEKGVKEKRILSLPVEKGLKEQRIEESRIPSQKSLARVHQDVKMPSTRTLQEGSVTYVVAMESTGVADAFNMEVKGKETN